MAEVIGYSEESKQRITCKGSKLDPGCGAIIAYTAKDIKERHGHDYSGGSDGARWVDCPGCGRRIVLEAW